ncbi:endonuclease MutS2 [Chloroflexota bacterium]
MDDKSLEILEFPQIKQILASFTSFSTSRQLALELQPICDYHRVALLLQQSAEARHLLVMEPNFSIGGVNDIRQEVKMASLGKILEPQSLLEIQQTLAAISQVRHRLKELSAELPLLWSIATHLVELENVVSVIASSLALSGQVLDSASANLASIRQQLRDLRQQLYERLEAIMKTPRGRKIIQEPVIVEREGRYVIPVKIEHRKEMKGIVHDVSNTGVTIFIEPWVTIDMGNTMRELVMEERREEERILQHLSTEVGIHEVEIGRSVELMAELDLSLAKSRYARKLRAVEPVLVNFGDNEKLDFGEQTSVMKLIEARHPLLGDTAVPLSVEIGRDFLALVITGPNTGGKTVALKTVGLLSLMTLSGIPIPASPYSQIPIFDNIFADIGDQQSIEQTLSSFSWHVGNIVRIINQATKKSLVLLDELGTSTDPVEGSVLAISILHYFLLHGTMTVATTHFSEVKAFAHVTVGMQNASFDFDPVTLIPTYHMTMGIPSGSNALVVAGRLGLLREIITEAERLLPEGNREMETLLLSLKSKEQEIIAIRRQLENEVGETVRRNRELETERRQLQATVHSIIRDARDEVTAKVTELNRQIREAQSELRREKSKERFEQARKTIGTTQEQLEGKVFRTGESERASKTSDQSDIAMGDIVWLREVGIRATVLSVSERRREINVQAGQMRLRLGFDKVDKVALPDGYMSAEVAPMKVEMALRSVSRELDLRGKRASEVESELDRYLNDASLASQIEARIIHGFGTGTVRQLVREFLETHSLVKSFRTGKQDEGGDGVTIVQL